MKKIILKTKVFFLKTRIAIEILFLKMILIFVGEEGSMMNRRSGRKK
jgi:hypothetical protein